MLLPPVQEYPEKTQKTGAVRIKIPAEGVQQVVLFLPVFKMGMAIVEAILTVGIGKGKFLFIEESSLTLVFFMKGSAGNRRVQHKLMKNRIVTDGIVDDSPQIFRTVIFKAEN